MELPYIEHQLSIDVLSTEDFNHLINSREAYPALMPEINYGKSKNKSQGDGKYIKIVPPSLPDTFPYKCVGKIFAYNNDDVELNMYVSSGCIIGKNTILTAAHCVYDPSGKIYDKILFFPGYPFTSQQNQAVKVFVPSRYKPTNEPIRENIAYDFALVYFKPDTKFAGNSSCGIVARRDTWKKDKWWTLGYPAKKPFAGNDMYYDGGSFSDWAFRRGGQTFSSWELSMDRFDLTPGCSGGPWFLIDPKDHPASIPDGVILQESSLNPRGRKHYINGLNSGTMTDKPGIIYSPMFHDQFINFYNAVKHQNPIETIV